MSHYSLRKPEEFTRDMGSPFERPLDDSEPIYCSRCNEIMDWDGVLYVCIPCEERATKNRNADEAHEAHRRMK